jgi:hypothetical protein
VVSSCHQKMWRNKPLFRREGDARFRTGTEAAQMLVQEVSKQAQARWTRRRSARL